jgi:hypothetical protein
LRARELGLAAVALLVLLGLFFLTPLRTGHLLSPADLLLKSAPWRHTVGPDFEPANALLSDYVYQFRPWRQYTTAALRAGRLPLWNPENAGGLPFLGAGISAVLYPLNLLFLALPDAAAVLAWAVVRLLVAGLATYAFARVIGLGACGAAVSAVAFAFSGFLVVWLLWPQVNVAIWLPALCLGMELLVRRVSVPRVLALAALVCVQFLGGHPETSLHILVTAAAYFAWRAVTTSAEARDRRALVRQTVAVGSAVLLGTAGAAVQLLPLGEAVLESATLVDRAAATPGFWSLSRPRWLAMLALVCPACLGSTQRGDVPLGAILGVGNFNEVAGGYVGLVALALVLPVLAGAGFCGIDRFFVVLGGVAFAVAYRIPPVANLIDALPLFRVTANFRALLVLAFALAMLAGRGAHLLLTAPASAVRPIARRAAAVLVVLAVGVGVLTALLAPVLESQRDRILEAGRSRLQMRAPIGGPDRHSRRLPEYVDRIKQLGLREGARTAGLLGLAALALAAGWQARHRRLVAAALPALVGLDLFLFGRDYNPTIPAALAYPPAPALQFLQRQPGLFRVLALDGALPPNTNLMYGLSDLRGYSAVETPAFHRFLAATGPFPQPQSNFRTLYFSNHASPLVDLANVRFVLSERPLAHPKLALANAGADMLVYENRHSLDRAFLVFQTRPMDDHAAAEALRDPGFEPRAVAVVESDGPRLAGPAATRARATVTRYEPEHVDVDVSSDGAALLILSDAWYRGWVATVDGAPTRIYRTNLFLRGVPIAPGEHRVRFDYVPRAFRLGLGISATAVAASLALGVVGARSWWRRRSGARDRPSRAASLV